MGDSGAELAFRVYKDIEVSKTGEFSGNMETAERRQTGYVYIFRKIRPNESNDDDTITRLWEIIDLSKRQRTGLAKSMQRHDNHYFFAYSRIELTEKRLEAIRKSLHRFIVHKKNLNNLPPSYYVRNPYPEVIRVNYIPIKDDMVDDRLFVSPKEKGKDVLYNKTYCTAEIYLYDWYEYLEKMKDEYTKKLDSYHTVLEKEVSLGDFSKGYLSQEQENVIKYMKFPNGSLYSFSQSLKTIVDRKSKYKNNLRYYIYEELSNSPYEVGDVVNTSAYEDFLKQAEGEIEPAKEECRAEAVKILNLYTQSDKRIHPVLVDYFYGTNDQKKDAMALMGLSIVENYNTLGQTEAEVFRRKMLEDIEEIDNCFDDEDIDDFRDKMGEGNAFAFTLSTKLTLMSSTLQSLFVLDCILQHAYAYATESIENTPPVYRDIIMNKSFRDIKGRGPILSTDESRIKSWLHRRGHLRNRGSSQFKNGKPYSFEEALKIWQQEQAPILQKYEDIKFVTGDIDGVKTCVAQYSDFELNEKNMDALQSKYGLADEVLTGIGKILDGFNLFMQVQAMMDINNGGVQPGYVVSIAGSTVSLLDAQLKSTVTNVRLGQLRKIAKTAGEPFNIEYAAKNAGELAGKIVGSAGTFLFAVEMSINCYNTAHSNDTDAAAFYGASAAFAIAAGVMNFIPGLNVAMWICLGIAVICAILGSLMEDDHIDLFLKYSLWGTHFHEAPDELSSWWINVNSENQEEGLLVVDETFKLEAPKSKKQRDGWNSEYRLDKLPENNFMLHKAIQMPAVEMGGEPFYIFTERGHFNSLYLKITNLNFSMVEHIKITLRQKKERRGLFRNRRNFQDMETLSEKIFLPYESIPYLRIGRAPVKLVENDDVANDVTMEAVNGFEILYLDSFRSVKSKFLNINDMSNQQLADLWNMPEYVEIRKLDFGCNKTIELLIQYSAPGLSPIKITKGFNQS